MGWLAEFRSPALKCERLGHKLRGEWRQGYITGSGGWLGGVVTRVREQRTVCTRCAAEVVRWCPVEGSARSITSFSASTAVWDQIESGAGWWPDTGRCEPQVPSEDNDPSSALERASGQTPGGNETFKGPTS